MCFLIQITWMVSIYVILAIRYLDHVTEIFSMYFGKSKMSLIWELGWPYSICHHSSFFFSLVHLLGISEGMKHFLLVVVLHLWEAFSHHSFSGTRQILGLLYSLYREFWYVLSVPRPLTPDRRWEGFRGRPTILYLKSLRPNVLWKLKFCRFLKGNSMPILNILQHPQLNETWDFLLWNIWICTLLSMHQ